MLVGGPLTRETVGVAELAVLRGVVAVLRGGRARDALARGRLEVRQGRVARYALGVEGPDAVFAGGVTRRARLAGVLAVELHVAGHALLRVRLTVR